MKKLQLILILCVASMTSQIFAAQSVDLAWDESPDTGVGTYRIHWGTVSGIYTQSTNAGMATEITVQGLEDNTIYYFVATAVGTNQLESEFSNEISYDTTLITNPPPATKFNVVADRQIASIEVINETWTNNITGEVYDKWTNITYHPITHMKLSWPESDIRSLEYKTNFVGAPWLASPTGTNNPAYFPIVLSPQMAFFRLTDYVPPKPPFIGVLYLTFSEGVGNTSKDLSAQGNDAVLNNAAWVNGYEGFGIGFDGSISYLDLPNIDVFGENLEIHAWIYAYSFDIDDARIISKASGVMEQDHYWMLSTTDSGGIKARFRLKAGGSTSTLIGNTTLNTGEWTHLKVSYDGSYMRIYVNDILDAELPKTGLLDSNSSVLVRIGQNPNGYGTFDGIIDEVMILNP